MPLLLLILLLSTPVSAIAGSTPDITGIAYEQRPGERLPLERAFRDENGESLRLSALMEGRPLILVLGYFHCKNLCGVVRSDLFDALKKSGLTAGRDYALAAISIDPAETAMDAAIARSIDLRRHPAQGAEQFWRFLTGDGPALAALSEAVGFHGRVQGRGSYMHPLGVVFVTPNGLVSNYLTGVGYQPGDVRGAVQRAAAGELVRTASLVTLLCYDFDAATGQYTFAIVKLLRIAAGLTVLAIAVGLWRALRYEGRGA